MTPEQRLWDSIRLMIPGDIIRIENAAGVGTPDVNACWKGNEVWLELKVCPENKVLVRKEQRVWGFRRSRAGGTVWVINKSGYSIDFYLHSVECVKHDDKYQMITSKPTYSFHKTEVKDFFLSKTFWKPNI
jgi:Holliday junction resolvase